MGRGLFAIGLAALMCGAAGPKIGVLTPAPPISGTYEAHKAWFTSNIVQGDDILVSYGERAVVLATVAGISRTDQDYIRVWMRLENYEPFVGSNGTARSHKVLTEFDCPQLRMRMLAVDSFPYNNTLGQSRSEDSQSAEWQYGRPGTVAEMEIKTVCGWKAEVDHPQPETNKGATWSYTK